MKRSMDVLLALVLLVPGVIVIAVAAIAIRAESSGPVIFRQTRIGRHRRPFTILKLRTMAPDTRSAASHEISRQAITRVGAFLRRTKLDELPQLWCVLKGDLSFVGPRPCLPVQEELIAERDKRGVFEVRPGITGPAQLAGIDMSRPRRLARIDAAYVAHRTLRQDIVLLARTFFGGGSGDAVKHEI